jgi:hypothetical protein
VTAATPGPRQAAVLEHLRQHPGLTAGELARVFGLVNLYKQLRSLERQARIVAVSSWAPSQGRPVARWHLAPPGTVPPPASPPDPDQVCLRRERDAAAQRARRARRSPPRRPVLRVASPVLAGAACKGADPDLFFGPDHYEDPAASRRRERQAKAFCAACPASVECLAYALDTAQASGVWGGLNEDERRALRRQRRAS